MSTLHFQDRNGSNDHPTPKTTNPTFSFVKPTIGLIEISKFTYGPTNLLFLIHVSETIFHVPTKHPLIHADFPREETSMFTWGRIILTRTGKTKRFRGRGKEEWNRRKVETKPITDHRVYRRRTTRNENNETEKDGNCRSDEEEGERMIDDGRRAREEERSERAT